MLSLNVFNQGTIPYSDVMLIPITAVYSAHNTQGENTAILMLLCHMVLHIISYKIIATVGIYTNFPACLRHLVQCLESCFL